MSARSQSHFMISLEGLVSSSHPYRTLESLIDFDALSLPLQALYSTKGRRGFGASFALRALVLQFIEDLSDREMERFMQENLACRWFCDLGLGKKAPDHSFFGDFRKRLGSKHLMEIFSRVRGSLQQQGLLAEVFTFVDASHLVSKLSTWDDRDKAIKKGLDGFNNKTASKVATDSQARMGCKGKNKYWYGYKEHVSVDMQSGLINKVAATPANVTDADGLKHVCPRQGAVYGDKGYSIEPATKTITRNGCHNATIKKNNMIGKNRDKDRWLSAIRSPYERVFSKRNRKVRYVGQAKMQFQVGINALIFNFKRLMAMGVKRINLLPA